MRSRGTRRGGVRAAMMPTRPSRAGGGRPVRQRWEDRELGRGYCSAREQADEDGLRLPARAAGGRVDVIRYWQGVHALTVL